VLLVRLGDGSVGDGLMAEVYTFEGNDGRGSNVVLAAEAEITLGNCGQNPNAQSIQSVPAVKQRRGFDDCT
jgi:hypothetical protein